MKIIILGAGQVGATLAENLVGEQNEITVVDIDGNRIRELQDKYDLQGVMGHSAHPDVLRRAGAVVVALPDERLAQVGARLSVVQGRVHVLCAARCQHHHHRR